MLLVAAVQYITGRLEEWEGTGGLGKRSRPVLRWQRIGFVVWGNFRIFYSTKLSFKKIYAAPLLRHQSPAGGRGA